MTERHSFGEELMENALNQHSDTLAEYYEEKMEKAIAAEREACAVIAEGFAERIRRAYKEQPLPRSVESNTYEGVSVEIAAAIREDRNEQRSLNEAIREAVAEEREACARIAERFPFGRDKIVASLEVAAAIRARGEER